MDHNIVMMGRPIIIAGGSGVSSEIAVPLGLDSNGRLISRNMFPNRDNFNNNFEASVHWSGSDGVVDTNLEFVGQDVFAYSYLHNGTTFDRERGNVEESILTSAVRAVDTDSADFTNYNNRGIHIVIDVTVITGAGVIPTIQGKDAVSGKYYDLLIGPTITATGTVVLKVYPGIGVVANGAASDILPRTYRVSMDHQDAANLTYSVGGNLVR